MRKQKELSYFEYINIDWHKSQSHLNALLDNRLMSLEDFRYRY